MNTMSAADQDLALFNPSLSPWFRTHPQLGVDLMEYLYSHLEVKYPRLWRQSFSGPAAITAWKELWAEAFEAEGITHAEIKTGLRNVSRLYPDFPPTEGQFLRCCRPPLDYETAYAEALKQLAARRMGEDVWSHPGVYWAAVAVGTYDLQNLPWSRIEKRWVAALDVAMRRQPCEPVPKATLAVTYEAPKVSGDEARLVLAGLRAALTKRAATVTPEGDKTLAKPVNPLAAIENMLINRVKS